MTDDVSGVVALGDERAVHDGLVVVTEHLPCREPISDGFVRTEPDGVQIEHLTFVAGGEIGLTKVGGADAVLMLPDQLVIKLPSAGHCHVLHILVFEMVFGVLGD